ncbi:unnamed protein product [Caretta caretta]
MIFLQETHTDTTAEESWRLEWGDRVYFSHSTIRQAGVTTLFSPHLRPEVLGVAEAIAGHLLHLRVHIEGLVVNLINVYAPTSGPERLQFYQQVSAFLSTLDPHECLVLGGDFNTTLEERDRSGTEQSLAAADTLQEIVEHHCLVDICTDYKTVVKAISLRLGSVLEDVIHSDQTYTIPDRSIFDNLFMVRDLLELGRRDGLSFALLSLDQEKAFDRVDHGYLLSTLQAFGFRPQFVGFLQVLYASAECLVKLNWTLTEPVSFGRGVRQGCPLSGQLYALAIKPFLCLLHRRLTGLVLQEPELRLVLSAYSDDVLLVIQDPGDLAWVEACQAIYSAALPRHLPFCHASLSTGKLGKFRGRGDRAALEMDGTTPMSLPLRESAGA